MNTHRKQKGLLSVELVVAISVLATIIGVLVTLEHSFGKLNNKLWAKHICRNAGQAQMDSIATTGTQIDNAEFDKLWPGVICIIEQSEGVGQWQGLQKIDLTLSKKVKRNNVRIQLTRYLLTGQGGAG